MKDNFCPKCGSDFIYVGISKIECGQYKNCDNFTIKQAKLFEEHNKKELISDENNDNIDECFYFFHSYNPTIIK